MAKEVAVFLGENGETTSLYEKGKIVIYRKQQGRWEAVREREFILDNSRGIKGLRQNMEEALQFLADCKIFVGLSIIGIPYFELEKAHCSVWEFEGAPQEFLDYIWEKEEEAQTRARETNREESNLLPVETSAGCYQISLKDIQTGNTGVTSKQVLLPFLRKGNFDALEILCSHVPPWLETELISGNLAGRVEKISKDEIRIKINKQRCQQC